MDKRIVDLRLQKWAQIIQEASRSGLSKSEWCRQNGIRTRQFFYWQKAVRERILDAAEETNQTNCTLPVQTMAKLPEKPDFYEVTFPAENTPGVKLEPLSSTHGSIEVHHGGFTFVISEESSEEALKTIVRVLSNA